MGNVLAQGAPYAARTAALAAGIPETVPVQTINRFCSSGLMAITTISNQIKAGQIDIGIAVGAESMSAKCVFSPKTACLSVLSPKLTYTPSPIALTKAVLP